MKLDWTKIIAHLSHHKELLIVIPLMFVFFGVIVMSGTMFGSLKSQHAQRAVQAVRDLVERVVPVIPDVPLRASHMKAPQKNPWVEDLNIGAQSAAVIDVDSGEMIYEKNAFNKRAIASTTKLLTAMVVLDSVSDIDAYVTITPEMLAVEGVRVGCKNSYACSGSRLIVGEEVSIRNLLEAMLIGSANDAAHALALHVDSSEEIFAERMNEQMRTLRLSSSNFCRPSGLEVDDPRREAACFSTARDVGHVAAIIAREARYNPIMEILGRLEGSFSSKDGTINHTVSTTNELLKEGLVIAGKTGFTPRAGKSFVGIAEDSDATLRFVTVVLDSPDRFVDTTKMIDWTLDSFVW